MTNLKNYLLTNNTIDTNNNIIDEEIANIIADYLSCKGYMISEQDSNLIESLGYDLDFFEDEQTITIYCSNLIVEIELNNDTIIIDRLVSKQDIEGIENGFLDTLEFIDFEYYCEENNINEDELKDYSYKFIELNDI